MSYQKLNMLPQSQVLELFHNSPLSELEDADIVKLIGLSECCLAREGECIRAVDNPMSALAIVASGCVSLYDLEHKKVLSQITEGQCFGMLSLVFPGHVYPEAYAEEDTVFILLDSVSFRMIELSDPKLAVAILRCIQTVMTPVIANTAAVLMRISG